MTSKPSEKKTVEEMAREYCSLNGITIAEEANLGWKRLPCPESVNVYIAGFHAGQAALLEQASTGFEELWNSMNYSGDCYCWDRNSLIASELKRCYQAATLAAEKRISFMYAQLDTMSQACNRVGEKHQEMLKDLEWALNERQTLRFTREYSKEDQKSDEIRTKWFKDKK